MSDTANADCPSSPGPEITDPCPLHDQQQIVDELVKLATQAEAAVTIVMNTAAMPTLAQIEATVAAVQDHRSHNYARPTAAI